MLPLKRDVNGLRADMGVQQAKQLGPTLGEFYAQYQGLYRLRGLWPMASITETPTVIDASGQGRTLSFNGTVPLGLYNDLMPYVEFNGTTGFLSRADEAGLDIVGTLTLGGWFWADSGAGIGALMSKYGSAVANRSYFLRYTGSNTFQFGIGNGVGDTTVVSAAGTGTTDAWHFVVGRYSPSAEVAVFVDGTWYRNTTSIPGAIVNGAAQLEIGRLNVTNGQYLDGRAGLCFLSAAALSDTFVSYLWNRSRVLFGV